VPTTSVIEHAPRHLPTLGLPHLALTALLIASFAFAGGFAIDALWSGYDFGNLAFWSLPYRIDYCGRVHYEDVASQVGSPRQFTNEDGLSGAKWTMVAKTLTNRPIYAVVTPVAVQKARRTPCAMVLYMSLGRQSWEPYSISGGP
jgi:hypothetical protein